MKQYLLSLLFVVALAGATFAQVPESGGSLQVNPITAEVKIPSGAQYKTDFSRRLASYLNYLNTKPGSGTGGLSATQVGAIVRDSLNKPQYNAVFSGADFMLTGGVYYINTSSPLSQSVSANRVAVAGKQNSLTLVTSRTSGPATLSPAGVLDIPQYSGGGGGGTGVEPVDFQQFPGLLLESDPQGNGTTTFAPVAGSAYRRRIVATKSGTLTRLGCRVTAPGTGLTADVTQNGIAIYDAAGNRLAIADGTTAFASAGDKLLTTDVSVSIVAGTSYYVVVNSQGTTAATFQAAGASPLVNYNQATAPFNYDRVQNAAGMAPTMATTGGTLFDLRTSARPIIFGFTN